VGGQLLPPGMRGVGGGRAFFTVPNSWDIPFGMELD
jgi:hypothetical protein